jgi:glycosyltransferase involved in cell wall biosynthesis
MNSSFSVIVPVYSESGTNHYRGNKIKRLLDSIIEQTYPNWELILVNDGCQEPLTPQIMQEYADAYPDKIKIITHERSVNRAISRNDGMKEAKNDWIIWADSDDFFSRDALFICDRVIKQHPETKVFNFGAILLFPDRIEVRHAWELPEPEKEGEAHGWFFSGHTNTGSFIFKRELLDDPANWIPNEESPYHFAATSRFDMRFPPHHIINGNAVEEPSEEIFTNGKFVLGISLGNPWGDDFLMMYLLSRKNKVMSIDTNLYYLSKRNGGRG